MNPFFGAAPDQLQPPAHDCCRPAVMHVGHSWGGGIDRWIHDYAAADSAHWNLLLRSRTGRNAAGVRLELVDLAGDDDLLLAWDLDQPIPCTAIEHDQYRHILDEIIEHFGIEAVLVSSLIGHALDVLDIDLPLVLVLHDFVPFCPALFAWFGQPCTKCDAGDLARCLNGNPLNLFWYRDDPDEWLALREAYAARIARDAVRVAAPGRAIHERYAALFPVLRDKPWHLIAHGLRDELRPPGQAPGHEFERAVPGQGTRLRLLVPARLAPHKGLYLFNAILPEVVQFADVLLLGCGDFGLPFRDVEHVEVIPDYAYADLEKMVRRFAPDCALLLSVLPESFSYTLSEMSALGVPVLATRLGAFAERITDGEDGFLVEPNPESILGRLRELATDRAALRRVSFSLLGRTVRSAEAMVGDYQVLLGRDASAPDRPPGTPRLIPQAIVHLAAAARFLREEGASQRRRADELAERVLALETTLANLEARAAAQEERADAQEARADAQEARADAQEIRADAQQARADAQEGRAATLERLLQSERASTQRLALQLAAAEARERALLSSTSWQLTSPLRAAAGLMRRSPPVTEGRAERDIGPTPPPLPEAAGEPLPGTGPAVVSEERDGAVPEPAPGGSSPAAAESAVPLPGTGLAVVSEERDGAVPETTPKGSSSASSAASPATRTELPPAVESDSLSQVPVPPRAAPPEGVHTQPPEAAAATGDDTRRNEAEPAAQGLPGPVVSAGPGASAVGASEPGAAVARPRPPQPPRVEVESGNLLALAHAQRLEQALGMPADQADDRSADRVPEGFSLLVRSIGPDHQSRLAACFEGIDGEPQAAATLLAGELDQVLVPSSGIEQCFRDLWPEARARLSVTPYPLMVERVATAERASLRMLQRKRLGVPDGTRLVLGIGPVQSRAGLTRFAALATQACECRNDVRFVWIGARRPEWERAHWLEVGLPLALRHLFLVADPDFAAWLLAADAYIGCRSPEVYDAGAVEALAAGLPVCVATRASLPDALRLPPCSEWVDEAQGAAVIDWLTARVTRASAEQSARPPGGGRHDQDIGECLGEPGLESRLVSLCTQVP